MIITNNLNNEPTFNFNQTKKFLKAIKDNRYECFFKLIMTYRLSRIELVCLEWKDVDFDKNTITIYPISQERNNQIYYKWTNTKVEGMERVFPLLPNIKNLLLEIKAKQELNKISNPNYDFTNENFVCLKDDGSRLNYNTLSRNLRYVARDNKLPQILLGGLKICLEEYICEKSHDYDYYRAWTRFDLQNKKRRDVYKNFNLKTNKRFLSNLNDLLEISQTRSKSDMDLWGGYGKYERSINPYV